MSDIVKPYYVELKVTAVVMAKSELDAHFVAERHHNDILRDSDLEADYAVEVSSMKEMRDLDASWTGDCIPFGGDEKTCLQDIVPEEPPFVDTKTEDMFGA